MSGFRTAEADDQTRKNEQANYYQRTASEAGVDGGLR